MKQKAKVMYDSPESAVYGKHVVDGWKDVDGRVWDSESAARYSSSTHRMCDKHGEYETRSYCRECWEEKQIEKFNAMPEEAWDGVSAVYSLSYDKWFFDFCQISDWLCDMEEHERPSFTDLRLVHAVPVKLHQIDEDYWTDDLHEDAELPDTVQLALRLLNDAIRQHNIDGIPSSYEIGKLKVDVENSKCFLDNV